MRFQLLGPLEVVDNGRPLAVNGSKQRAALGFLLLHVNSVVATSTLLKALWPVEMPNTGRKMLQNAISGLRGMMSPSGYDSESTVLLTHAPGYLLRAPSDSVDLNRFHDKVNGGRALLADGYWPQAASTLRDALSLWRGPVLADLVELGVDWPELTTVRNARLAAIEDYVDAEFACGRYGEVTHELETWVEAEPLRERLCGQLMRALYHHGRQADALGVYRRIRTRMIDELGLDPGRELQELEQAILNQELVLESTRPPARQAPPAEPRRPVGSTPPPAKRPEPGPFGHTAAELKWVSVVVVMTRFGRDDGDACPEYVDAELQHVAATIREEAEQLGGIIGGTIGPLRLAMFGPLRSREDDAARAVRAALAIRDRLRCGTPETLTVTIAVTTGDALVRRHRDDRDEPPMVTGAVLDRCLRLLTQIPDNEVRVCTETRRASDSEIAYDAAVDQYEGSSAVAVLPRQSPPRSTVPFVSRDRELDMLLRVLDQVGTRTRPHLVTVLGEPGIGKTRLITEFHRATAARARFITGRTPRIDVPGALAALADGVRSYAGISDVDTAERAERKLSDAVTRLTGDGTRSAWILSHLRALLGGQEISRESFPAWRQFLEAASGEEPLVLVVEDLHLAEDLLLDFIDYVTGNAGPFPMLVVVTARTELLDRRPTWAGGKAGATTVTLDPLSDEDTTRLLAMLHGGQCPGGTFRALVSHIGGNPLFAVEYARTLRAEMPEDARALGVPPLVHRIVASRLDSLPAETKAVLVDAAVICSGVCAEGVSAVGGQQEDEVSVALEHLERHGLLTRAPRREPGSATYEFRHQLIREVAYLTIPQAVRAGKHQRAAAWVELLPCRDADLLAYHHSRALTADRVPAQRGAAMLSSSCVLS